MKAKHLGKCAQCHKRSLDEQSARDTALRLRTHVSTLSGVRGGYTKTRAYACPHGHGWHVGRKRDWEEGQ